MNNDKELATMSFDRFDHDDFDRLLEESSLGTAAARKNQAETPAEVHQRVHDHLRGSEVTRHRGDVDDFLFHLVRLCSGPNDTEPASSELANAAFSIRLWMLRHKFRWRADAVPGIVQTLLDKEVFSYLRQDVARSMVSLCFNSRTPLPLAILSACASAVPASSFRDELADAFMKIMPSERTALPADSRPKRTPDEQDAIYHAGRRAHGQTQRVLTMIRPLDGTAQSLRQGQGKTDLFLRACERDQAAWEEILHRYEKLVSTTVRSFRLQEADALDAVQATWVRLAENCHRIQFPEHLGGWLATTARRECLRILRHQARHTPAPHDAAAERVTDPSVGPEHVVYAGTAQRRWSLVATLPSRHQRLIRKLFGTKPQPYTEVARDTGIPAGGIGPTRARALTQLRRALDETRDHDDEIREVVWSRDGQLLATASNDSTTQIEDTGNGNELVVLQDHDDGVQVMARSPDGRELVAMSRDYTTWIWSTDGGNELIILQDHDDEIRDVTQIWDVGNGSELAVLRGSGSAVGITVELKGVKYLVDRECREE